MTSILVTGGDGQGVIRQQVYANPDASVLPVSGSVQALVRTDFSSASALTSKFTVSQTGTGMAYNVANGMLTITTGTTLGDELSILTQSLFTLPIRAIIAVNLSQRIVGQTVTLELVSVDPVTGLTDGVSSCAWVLDGTSATTGIYTVSTGSMPRLYSGNVTIPTTASTGWSVVELEGFMDQVWFHGRSLDSTNARTNSYVRDQQVPTSDRSYRLGIRVTNRQTLSGVTAIAAGTAGVIRITRNSHGYTTADNVTVDNVAGLTGTTWPWTGAITVVDANNIELPGTTFAGAWVNTGWTTVTRNLAPATSTTVNLNFVTIVDYVELNAEITAGRGSSAAGQAMSMYLAGGPTGANAVQVQGAGTNVSSGLAMSGSTCSSTVLVNTTARAVAPVSTLNGALTNKPFSIPEADWQFACSAAITVTTDTVVKTTAGASLRNMLVGGQMINTHASIATEVTIKDGSAVIWRGYLPAAMTTPVTLTFLTPLKGSANTAINFACATAASVYANFQGYTAT